MAIVTALPLEVYERLQWYFGASYRGPVSLSWTEVHYVQKRTTTRGEGWSTIAPPAGVENDWHKSHSQRYWIWYRNRKQENVMVKKMKRAESVEELADEQGWDDASMLALCRQYIDNQQDDAAFLDFLQRAADEENS